MLRDKGAEDISDRVGLIVSFADDPRNRIMDLPFVRWYEMNDGTCVAVYFALNRDFQAVVGGIVTGDIGIPYQGKMSAQRFRSTATILVSESGTVERLQADNVRQLDYIEEDEE